MRFEVNRAHQGANRLLVCFDSRQLSDPFILATDSSTAKTSFFVTNQRFFDRIERLNPCGAMPKEANDVITELRFNRPGKFTGLLQRECCLLKGRDHTATFKPTQTSTILTGAIVGKLLGKFFEILIAFLRKRHYMARQLEGIFLAAIFGGNQNMLRLDLLRANELLRIRDIELMRGRSEIRLWQLIDHMRELHLGRSTLGTVIDLPAFVRCQFAASRFIGKHTDGKLLCNKIPQAALVGVQLCAMLLRNEAFDRSLNVTACDDILTLSDEQPVRSNAGDRSDGQQKCKKTFLHSLIGKAENEKAGRLGLLWKRRKTQRPSK